MQNIRTILFSIVMLIYLWVPFSMISNQENILKDGTPFLFRTAPVDPYDAFRGKYVALSIMENTVPITDESHEFTNGQTVYAGVSVDTLGYAYFSEIYLSPPSEWDYITTQISRVGKDKIFLKVPENLQRYYLNEKLAPLVEQAYRNMSRRQNPSNLANAHLKVRVKKGAVLLEELYLQQIPVGEFLEKEMIMDKQ